MNTKGIYLLVFKSKLHLIIFTFNLTMYFQDFKSCRYRFSVVVEELRQAKANEYR